MSFTESITARNDQTSLDDFMERVEANADAAWKTKAFDSVIHLCRTRRQFTADDVWELLAGEEVGTHEPRALGAVIVKAAKSGLCRSTGRYEQSRLPVRHRRPVVIWESCEHRASIPQ